MHEKLLIFQKSIKKYYNNNKTYVKMLATALVLLIILQIIILSCLNTEKIIYIGKSWEIVAYLLTLAYSIFFWNNKNAVAVIQDIKEVNRKYAIKGKNMILCLLAFITLGNIALVMFYHDIPICVGLFGSSIIFGLFCSIDLLIALSLNDEKKKQDFIYAFKNTDFPTLCSFLILTCYSVLISEEMTLFFSGATSFQLISSTFIWSNTEITNN